MNTKVILGIVLIVLGIVAFAWQGITYTKREKVLDIGPIQATTETKETIPLPPIAGAILLIGGIAVLATSRK
jgi:uncharacterized membrane protein HdeD (DUF308 family)